MYQGNAEKQPGEQLDFLGHICNHGGMITEQEALRRLSKNLTAKLEAKDMYQTDLADILMKAGGTRTGIAARLSRALNRKNMPSPAFLLNVAEVLGCSIDDLLRK